MLESQFFRSIPRLDAELILKLRERAGWWCGDRRAAQAIAEYRQQVEAIIRKEYETKSSNAK